MAEKYIRHGATFNGDGTSSALATVDGGVGAWNDLFTLLLGTAPAFGTLGAGDSVNIRALDEAGVALSATLTANTTYGNTAATSSSPIIWMLDDGSIWTGVVGGLNISSTSNINVTILKYNNLYGSRNDRNLVFSLANISNKAFTVQSGILGNVKLLYPTPGTYGCKLTLGTVVREVTELVNILISSEKWYQALITGGSYSIVNLLDFDLDIPFSGETDPILKTGSYGANINWFGGSISGAGLPIASDLHKTNVGSGDLVIKDVAIPQSLNITSDNSQARVSIIASDAKLGMYYHTKDYTYDSRDDGNYPTLNAKLPTSTSTPFSIKLYPHKTQDTGYAIIPISKLWTQAAKSLTVTANFLIDVTLAIPTSENFWIDYSYIEDGTDNRVVGSTRTSTLNASNIPSSTALWSSTSYGASNYNKHELVFTTPTAVKQDTLISIKLQTSILSPAAAQVLFIDPEVLTV